MINYFKNLKFKLSDCFLMLGLVASLPCLIERTFLVKSDNASLTTIPLWILIASFFLMVGCFVAFIVLERNNGLLNIKGVVIIPFAIILIISAISIFVQPNEIHSTVLIQNSNVGVVGSSIDVTTTISTQTKLVSFFCIVTILIGCYIGFFVLPKRVKRIETIIVACFLFHIYLLVCVVFSYISEFNNYIQLFKNVFTLADLTTIDQLAPKSFLYHRNIYGTFLMFGIFTSLISYQIKQREVLIFLGVLLYFNLLLTIYKSGIILTTIAVIAYFIYRSIKYLKINKKNALINLITIGSLVLLIGVLFIVLYFSVNTIHERIDSLFKNGDTLKSRINIWKTTYIILQPAWWLIGRGGWIFNNILRNCNIAAQGDYTGSTHNVFLSLISIGGIPLLLGFVAICIYAIKKGIKAYKFNSKVISSVLLCFITYMISGIIEANYYTPLIVLIGLLIIASNINQTTIINQNKHEM